MSNKLKKFLIKKKVYKRFKENWVSSFPGRSPELSSNSVRDYINSTKNLDLSDRNDMWNAIGDAFSWEGTEEGCMFWEKLNEEFLDMVEANEI